MMLSSFNTGKLLLNCHQGEYENSGEYEEMKTVVKTMKMKTGEYEEN